MFSLPIRTFCPGLSMTSRASPATSIRHVLCYSPSSASCVITASRHYSDLQHSSQSQATKPGESGPLPKRPKGPKKQSKLLASRPIAQMAVKAAQGRLRAENKSGPAQSGQRRSRIGKAAEGKAQVSSDGLSQLYSPTPKLDPSEMVGRPWYIRRTPSMKLPVYTVVKSGGTRKVTTIKKVEGDMPLCVKAVKKLPGIKDDDVRLNPATLHIEIKGDVRKVIIKWLLGSGF